MKLISFSHTWGGDNWRQEGEIEIRPRVLLWLVDDCREVEAFSLHEVSKAEILEAWSHFAFGSSSFPMNRGEATCKPIVEDGEWPCIFGPVENEEMFQDDEDVLTDDELQKAREARNVISNTNMDEGDHQDARDYLWEIGHKLVNKIDTLMKHLDC